MASLPHYYDMEHDEKRAFLAAEPVPLPTGLPNPVQAAQDKKKKRRRRVFRFFFITLLFFVGMRHFGPCYGPRSGMRDVDMFSEQALDIPDGEFPPEWDVPPFVKEKDCADLGDGDDDEDEDENGPGTESIVSGSYDLPLTSDLLFLISRGPLSHGVVNITQSDEESENLKVDVDIRYWSLRDLKRVKLCKLTGDHGQTGVGIFSHLHPFPPHRHPETRTHVEIKATFPKSSSSASCMYSAGDSLKVTDFVTDLPLFAHLVGDLSSTISFESIRLSTANLPILVESLQAKEAKVVTKNNRIDGSFNVSHSLTLSTANAPITVNVSMVNDAKENNKEEYTELFMTTANGPIVANVTLSSSEDTGGFFKIGSHTANAPNHLNVTTAPVDSTVLINSATSIAPASVQLPVTFEGAFTLSSSWQTPQVVVDDEEAKDPKGRERERKVEFSKYGRTVEGTTSWDEDGKKRGWVTAATSFSPVSLYL